MAPPDPIPNSEVKRVSADNIAAARRYENRSSPGDIGAVFYGILQIMIEAPVQAFRSKKIISLAVAARLTAKLRNQGKRIGLCHGGFDLLHPGRVKHFESAKKLCDVLVVSITSDRFVTERKGTGRPIFSERLRAYMVARVDVVDYVVITDFKRGVDVINILKPNLYIKGPDMIGKQTPGITAEREAIAAAGGSMVYTRDPKLSTTEIIDYIKTKIKDVHILLILDRDGTLITNNEFFGTKDDWKETLEINEPVVSLVSYLQTKYRPTKIVVTNQSGVARGSFSEARVRQINSYLNNILQGRGITIANWQYCPDVDASFTAAHAEIRFIKRYVKKTTKRKPSPRMIEDALKELGIAKSSFSTILVIGDQEEDKLLAKNLSACFLDVSGKSYNELVREAEKLLAS